MGLSHPKVRHPKELLKRQGGWVHKFTDVVTNALTTTLGSFVVFLACFFVPLLAVPASTTVKLIVAIIFSNWFQAWALPILQRSANKTQAQNDAKAEVDHETLTYLATQVDNILKEVKK